MRDELQEAMARAAASLSRGILPRSAQAAGRTISVVAGAPGEGVTTVTAGLAGQLATLFQMRALVVAMNGELSVLQRALAHAGISADLIDADAVGERSTASALVGLTQAPAAPLGMVRVLERARAAWDVVLVDTPPCHDSVEAMLAARACGQAVLVIRAGNLPWEALREVRDELERDEVQVIGTVMNFHKPSLPAWLERLTR